MRDRRFEMRVSADLLARVDAARGDVSRAQFIARAIEGALGSPAPASASARPAPRASVDSGRSATPPWSAALERQARLNAQKAKHGR